MKIEYKKTNSNVPDLKPVTPLNAGLGLCARINLVNKTGYMMIPTGIVIQVPMKMVALVFLTPEASKYMQVRNMFIIDNNSREEIKLHVNVDNANHLIKPYDIIAEMLILPLASVEPIQTHQIGTLKV